MVLAFARNLNRQRGLFSSISALWPNPIVTRNPRYDSLIQLGEITIKIAIMAITTSDHARALVIACRNLVFGVGCALEKVGIVVNAFRARAYQPNGIASARNLE